MTDTTRLNMHDALTATVTAVEELDVCPCMALPHISEAEGSNAALDTMLIALDGMASNITDFDELRRQVGHFLVIVMATGYALGADDAHNFLATVGELSIPDTLAAVEFVDSYGERPEDN